MAIVNIAIENRIASVDAGIVLVCNNPTDTIQFLWDAEWEAIETKTARFAWDKDYIDVSFTGNMVQVPEIHHTDFVLVGIYCNDIATTPVKIPCRRSILSYGGEYKRLAINDPFYYEFIDRILAAEATVEEVDKLVHDTLTIASESGIQVNLPGNAGTATKLQTARQIGNATFDGSADITLSDMGAAEAGHTHTAAEIGAAEAEHTHTAAEIGAAELDHTHTAAEVGAAAQDHTHTAEEVGAASTDHTHTLDSLGIPAYVAEQIAAVADYDTEAF